MSSKSIDLSSWIQTKGKIIIFRFIVGSGAIIMALSVFGIFEISISVILLFLLSVVFLFAEVFLEEIKHVKELKNEGLILNWNETTIFLRTELLHAKEVTIVARTGETFYHSFRDIFLDKGNFNIKLILTQTRNESEELINHQKVWISRWQNLNNEISGNIEIFNVVSSFEIRGVILDDFHTYFGYRKKHTENIASIVTYLRTTTFSSQGTFIMEYIKKWIENHELIKLN